MTWESVCCWTRIIYHLQTTFHLYRSHHHRMMVIICLLELKSDKQKNQVYLPETQVPHQFQICCHITHWKRLFCYRQTFAHNLLSGSPTFASCPNLCEACTLLSCSPGGGHGGPDLQLPDLFQGGMEPGGGGLSALRLHPHTLRSVNCLSALSCLSAVRLTHQTFRSISSQLSVSCPTAGQSFILVFSRPGRSQGLLTVL